VISRKVKVQFSWSYYTYVPVSRQNLACATHSVWCPACFPNFPENFSEVKVRVPCENCRTEELPLVIVRPVGRGLRYFYKFGKSDRFGVNLAWYIQLTTSDEVQDGRLWEICTPWIISSNICYYPMPASVFSACSSCQLCVYICLLWSFFSQQVQSVQQISAFCVDLHFEYFV